MVLLADKRTDQKFRSGHLTFKEGEGDTGAVSAVVSVFNEVDSDGDVVRAGAFTDGQEVPMVWSHDWTQMIGKGQIAVQEDRAVFNGQFFMDTERGREAHSTAKAMGDLLEWSWGFRILEAEIGDPPEGQSADGLPPWREGKVQYIDKTEVFEVSPVLVGANRNTRTLGIKADVDPHAHIEQDIDLRKLWQDATTELKEGRRLSGATLNRINQAISAMKSAIGAMEKLVENSADDDDDDGKQSWLSDADAKIEEALQQQMDAISEGEIT